MGLQFPFVTAASWFGMQVKGSKEMTIFDEEHPVCPSMVPGLLRDDRKQISAGQASASKIIKATWRDSSFWALSPLQSSAMKIQEG
jgi:hypothetical protein